jgi:hypothetical protein
MEAQPGQDLFGALRAEIPHPALRDKRMLFGKFAGA